MAWLSNEWSTSSRILSTLTLVWCSVVFIQGAQAKEPSSKFCLGVAVCLSGACAEWGTSALRGVQLAAEEINAAGGILGKQVEIIAEDTDEAISGTAAVRAFQSLLARRDIQYIVGPSWSPAGLALIPILSKEKQLIAITPSMAVPDFARASDNLFKTVPDNETTASHIARYAVGKGLRKCAIISNQLQAERYTTEVFTKEYERLGGEVIKLVETLPDETDLRGAAFKLLQSKPEVIFLANYVQVGPAARRLRELGYKGPFISILLDRTRLSEGSQALEGTVFSKYVSFSADFDRKYRQRFGEPYGPSADSAYDTVYLLRESIHKAGTFDTDRVKRVLPGIQMQGSACLMRFNRSRTVEKPPLLFEVRQGVAQLVE